ncbi:MAG: rRNA maturation RNase YbeY [Chlamydiae bacterium]|nr:rRNA maturation RNase YbeY [Chlamydiota bacterium]MBI3266408.1 rRNA maturation RNase YbeY [Chlamydiota bacterium]
MTSPKKGTPRFFINIINRQSKFKIHPRKVKALAKAVLSHEKVFSKWPVELDISFVTDRRIRTLNRRFLGHEGATDVIAFPVDALAPQGAPWMLGEIVVSLERAKAQSKTWKRDFHEEALLYIIHGILHLLGYRDDRPSLKRKMWERQDEILKKVFQGI